MLVEYDFADVKNKVLWKSLQFAGVYADPH